MRPDYSAALHDLLEDVVETSNTRRPTARPRSRSGALRTVLVTSLVAAAVVGTTAVVLSHAPAPRAADPAASPTPSSTTPDGMVYLGLVPWTDPEALANPTRLLTVREDPYAVPHNPNSCGVSLVLPTVTTTPDDIVTITLRGYGTRTPRDTACGAGRFTPVLPDLIVLNSTIHVHALTDPATHTIRPLSITPLPATTRQTTTAPTAGDVGIQAYPVPAGTSPRVTPRQAVHTCLDGGSVCGIGAPSTITLALVTNPNAGPVGKNGKVTPTVVRRLGYVLAWRNQTCAASGGPPARPGTHTSLRTFLCINVAIVDALSGKNLFSYDTGRIKP